MNTTTLRLAQRTGLVLAAAATVLVSSTGTAQAAVSAKITFTTDANGSGVLTYTAGDKDPSVAVTRSGNTVTFDDTAGARILSGTDRCVEHVLAGKTTCSTTGIGNIVMNGSADPDSFYNLSGIRAYMFGLGGKDYLNSNGNRDYLSGGAGDDYLLTGDTGGDEYDTVNCGDGAGDRWHRDPIDGGGADCEIVVVV